MVRKLANTLLSLLLVVPSVAFALGMGDIKLHSALNQPFKADIELLSVSADEAESLKVGLASHETFARIGLDRPAALMFLRFNVEQSGGRHFIRISSTEPIREPFLSFLVETSWRSGRLLREYTVLIDPPGMGEEEPPVVQAPVVATTKPVAAPAAPVIVSGAAPAQAAPAPVAGSLSYGRVKADETLWSIASRMRPDKSVSTQQMMMALLKANPEAFYDNNVNRLKMGYVLRLDDPALITAMSHADAVRAISAQNRAWQDYVKGAASDAAARPATPSSAQAARAVAAPVEPRLKLVAPEGTGKAAAGTATSSEADADIRKELLLAQESTEAQVRENEQLRNRMQELEGQLASMQRLLSLKDSDLAALQQQMGTEAPVTTTPSAPVDAEPAAPIAAEAPATPEPATAEEAAPVAGTPAAEAAPAVEETKPAAPAARPAPVRPAPPLPVAQPSFLDEVMEDPLMLGGLGAVVLALLVLLGLFFKRRRAGGPGFSESILTAGGTSVLNSKTTSGVPSEESSLFSDLAVSGMNSAQGADSEVDPLTEADVYMAYGRYQQAEELLKEALKSQPERHDTKVKLLEVYYATKDRAAFEPLADEVFTALEGSGPLWSKVLMMGHELCPDNPMFSAAPEPGAGLELGGHGASDDVLDIGIDLDALAEDMESSSEGGGAAFNLDLGVDFSDLDEGAAVAEPASMVARKGAAAEDSPLAEMDFDLGGLDEMAPEAAPQAISAAPEPVAAAADEAPEQSMDFDLGDFQFGDAALETSAEAPAAPKQKEESLLDLDMGDLNLELGGDTAENAAESGLAALDMEPAATLPVGDEESGLGDLGDFGDMDMGDLDAVGTKLDLARAYVDMGEPDSARSILNEVLAEGDDKQKTQAQELLNQLS